MLARHVIEAFKAALINVPPGTTFTSVNPKPSDSQSKLGPISAKEKQKQENAHVVNLFLRGEPGCSNSDHLVKVLGPSQDVASPSSFANLSASMAGNFLASSSLVLLNKENTGGFRTFVWIYGTTPTFSIGGTFSHLSYPIVLRNANSKFNNRNLEDVKTDMAVLIALTQGALGVQPMDGTAAFIFEPITTVLSGNAIMWKLSTEVIEAEISRALSVLSTGLFAPETSNLTRLELLKFFARDQISKNFSVENMVIENTFINNGNSGFYRAHQFTAYPVKPANGKRESPVKDANSPGKKNKSVNGGGGTPGGGGKNHDDKPPLPCHNFIASELGIPGAEPCRFGEESCCFDHTPLPSAGKMTEDEKTEFCDRIRKAPTRLKDAIIEAISNY